MRTTKVVVEENVLEGRDAGRRLTVLMVHHAAQVICACNVGAGGLTPLRRMKVRKFGTPLAVFGEHAWLRDPVPERVKQVQSEMHGGEVAWILRPVVPLHRGGL